LQQLSRRSRVQVQGHPNVVQLLDSFHTTKENGFDCPIMVLSFAAGGSLDEYSTAQRAAGRWTTAAAVRALTDIAAGLAHVHKCGSLHNDLKPSNMLVMADGSVVLADFYDGARSGRSLGLDAIIHTDLYEGTPLLWAPEGFDGSATGQASDIWALGITAYQLLVGDFESSGHPCVPPGTELRTSYDLVRLLMSHPPPNWSRLPADTPPTVRTLLAAMLSYDPAARPTAAQVHAELLKLSAVIVGPPGPDGKPIPRYRLDGELGAGAYGVAHRATCLADVPALSLRKGDVVVVKVTRDAATDKIVEEAEMLRKVR
jgi:serine/threonine protein kinase